MPTERSGKMNIIKKFVAATALLSAVTTQATAAEERSADYKLTDCYTTFFGENIATINDSFTVFWQNTQDEEKVIRASENLLTHLQKNFKELKIVVTSVEKALIVDTRPNDNSCNGNDRGIDINVWVTQEPQPLLN